MTKLDILDILDKVFVGQAFYADPTSKFSVIDVPGTGLRFFTYSTDSSKSDCIVFNVLFTARLIVNLICSVVLFNAPGGLPFAS